MIPHVLEVSSQGASIYLCSQCDIYRLVSPWVPVRDVVEQRDPRGVLSQGFGSQR